MKYTFSVLLLLLVADVSSAGLFRIHSKGCSDGCPNMACAPVIARPSCTTIFDHQRRTSGTKCCAEEACGPASCCAPIACLGADCSAPELFCSAEPSCCVPDTNCCLEPSCAAASGCSLNTGCGDGGCGSGAACYSNEDCKVIAQLIYQSMTGCYASIRRKAIHRMGDHFDCVCHPEIMTAFVHALNDSDESVREKAADEIGDQIRRNRVCVGQPVVRALQAALADCDRAVRRQAEEALRLAGYRIVDGACCVAASTPHLMTPTEPPQIHPELSSESEVPQQQLLPVESEFSTDYTAERSLKVRPVSSSIVSKLRPITDKLLKKQRFESANDIIPPPVAAAEPDDYVPAVPTELDLERSSQKGGLMKRLFGELRE